MTKTFSWLAVFLLCAGSAFPRGGELAMTVSPSENVYQAKKTLPADMKRVVVLPLASESGLADLSAGCEMLGPVLESELVQVKRFEVVRAGPGLLRNRFGGWNWCGTEALPPDFLGWLGRTCGADAVLFCQLTEFHAYAPLAIGWRLKLVDVRTGEILWSTDEMFRADDPATAARARQFRQFQPPFLVDRGEKWLAVNSPRRFGRFSVATLLKTLPGR